MADEKIFCDAAAELGISISRGKLQLFRIYRDEIILWNRRINLVSVKKASEIWIKHFIDSLTVLFLLQKQEAKLLDIGAGAGFPGVPLKIVREDLDVYLLESSRRRVSFLKHVCRSLGLKNISVIHHRVEDFAKEVNSGSKFDAVISRAALKLPDLIRIGSKFLTEDGQLIAMKGPNIQREIDAAEPALKQTGLLLSGTHSLTLPVMGDNRKILLYKRHL